MKKMGWIMLCILIAALGFSGVSNASLIEIGTASYDSDGASANAPITRKLIYEDDQGLIWWDYTHAGGTWSSQDTWAKGLNTIGEWTYSLNEGLSINWDLDDGWRLPATVDGAWVYGYEGDPNGDGIYTYTGGYNLANSEMGHLFYESLGNIGYRATDGTWGPPGWGLTNKGPFTDLQASHYWSGTEYSPNTGSAWYFYFGNGNQTNGAKGYNLYALAVRPGDVVSAVPVPEPATMLFLATGLAGLGTCYKRKRRRLG